MKIAQMRVDLLDHLGTDLTVVNAARVSFDKESTWEQTNPGEWPSGEHLSGKDAKLINYLAKHDHWSPFAHTSLQFRIKAPIFVARQLVKHQVGGVWNEVSRRYVDSEPEFWFPEVWRGRPEGSMKQGSSGEVDLPDEHNPYLEVSLKPIDTVSLALNMYKHMLECGVAPEQARMILPQNTMTEWYWTGSLMFFARVCKLRLDPHAQAETTEVAKDIAAYAAIHFPVSWEALTS